MEKTSPSERRSSVIHSQGEGEGEQQTHWRSRRFVTCWFSRYLASSKHICYLYMPGRKMLGIWNRTNLQAFSVRSFSKSHGYPIRTLSHDSRDGFTRCFLRSGECLYQSTMLMGSFLEETVWWVTRANEKREGVFRNSWDCKEITVRSQDERDVLLPKKH